MAVGALTLSSTAAYITACHASIHDCLIRDRHLIRRKLHKLAQYQSPPPAQLISEISRLIERSRERAAARRASIPIPTFDPSLPVNQNREVIKHTISCHPVTILCGETGSGKTTQLPKICLELGYGIYGLIGHTQPRRLAARSVALRIAKELGCPLGEQIGFKVRFSDKVSEHSMVKLMTDGILLAEAQTDRDLTYYDTIIIDEAHERSLNIDFILGYLKQLLPRRPDLKVIITSATIDADRFARHFDNAPVIEVSGRTFPVAIHYRPLKEDQEDKREMEMEDAIVEAIDQLAAHGPGDILVFLPGEREIRETLDKLCKVVLKGYEVLPLFARLSNKDQQRIFKPSSGRRVVLATNVAETSLTVPGIKYVIDTGYARIKRYSPRSKVEQLQIEPISQAAARQRSGRCGRIEAGICIRLYSEEDFKARPAFTDPEILRANLAAVILRMSALELGSVDTFAFIEAPSSRLIADGYHILAELGAVDSDRKLTPLGKELARLPVDPKVGRMLLAARDLGCIPEMLIIASALSIQDPRERPFDKREAAERAQAPFADPRSDFLSFLKLWEFFEHALRQQLSHRQLVNLCQRHYLSWLRLCEWRELHGQLGNITNEMGLIRQPATVSPRPLSDKERQALDKFKYDALHKALLTGLIGNIGMKSPQGDDYLSARGGQFALFPASILKKSKPKWVMAAELVTTTRLYARCVGRIDPAWVETLAPHLVKYHYFNPHWQKKRGDIVASERVTLYGLTLVSQRLVSYSRIAPEQARELFIRQALVAMDYVSFPPFLQHNQQLIHQIEQLEHKARRQDVLVDDEVLFGFYNQRLPAHIVDAASFDAWRHEAEKTAPQCLFISPDELMHHTAQHVSENQFPEWIAHEDGPLRVGYRFEPQHVMDGVTVDVPLTILNRLSPEPFEWLVPGMIREKIHALIKSLPKSVRRACMPVPDFITRFLSSTTDTSASLTAQLAQFIEHETGQTIKNWATSSHLSPHLLFNFRVIDAGHQELGMQRDLLALQRQLGPAAQLTFRDSAAEFERDDVKNWDFGDLPISIQFSRGTQQLVGYPALSVEDGNVALRLFDTALAAERAHRSGVIRLIQGQLKEPMKQLSKGLTGMTQIGLTLRAVGHVDELLSDAITAICDRAFMGEDELPRTEEAFNTQKTRSRARLASVTQAVTHSLSQIANAYQMLTLQLNKHPLATELKAQLNHLIYPGFLAATSWGQLSHLPRYLQAMLLRMNKYAANPQRDRQHADQVRQFWEAWLARVKQQTIHQEPSEALLAFRWHIEELRVSLFTQELKTPYPVSVKRLQKIWSELLS